MQRSASYTLLSPDVWNERIESFDRIARSCELCPRACKCNRLTGKTGFCGALNNLTISSIFPHHGEEPPISGKQGSGTIFFTYCTLKCIFCQNFQLSHEAEGGPYSPLELAQKMMGLQEIGCHNINLVTPTHFLPWIVRALKEAARLGLTIPIVYNCSGYEQAHVLSLLNGIIDIYLPDMKYGTNGPAALYSKASDYVEVNQHAIREMFRQVGPLRIDDEGIAYRGLCIRHLVLPHEEAATLEIFNYLQSTYDPQDIYMSLMAQYHPLYHAHDYPKIDRMITAKEYAAIKEKFLEIGFSGFYQEYETIDRSFIIDFKSRKSERLTGDN